MRAFILFMYLICFSITSESKDLPAGGQMKKIEIGQTLISILKKQNWSDANIAYLLSYKELKSFTLIPDQAYYEFQSPQRSTLVFFEEGTESAYFMNRHHGKVSIERTRLNYKTKVHQASGEIVGGLHPVIVEAVGDKAIVQKFMNAFILDYNLSRGIERGAKFFLKYEKKYLNNIYILPGEVLEAHLELEGQMIKRRFVRFANGGGAFVDPSSKNKKPFYAPVEYVNVSSLFQPRRKHPIKGRIIPHMGIDFALETGAPVYSVAGGRILRFGKVRAAGNFVVIEHPNGMTSFYNHLHHIEPLRVGQQVPAGYKIGSIGCTGYCTKPHLHFAVKKGGKFINPANLVKTYPYHKEQKIFTALKL